MAGNRNTESYIYMTARFMDAYFRQHTKGNIFENLLLNVFIFGGWTGMRGQAPFTLGVAYIFKVF